MKKKIDMSIAGLERLLEDEEQSAVTILPDGTVLFDEEKQQQRKTELLTRRLDVGATY